MNDSQRETIEFLGNADSYTPKPQSVERRETHGAIVFLAGERAYKLKRAVSYPYMDYSTVEARRLMCERELAVNRRTAPDLYIGARPVVRGADGHVHFGNANEGRDAIDWVVVMGRFAETGLLADMRRRDEITPALMRRLGEEIGAFHNRAEPIRNHGGARGIGAVVDENAGLLRQIDLDAGKVARLDALSREALKHVAPLLDRRRDQGWVRRCHGDLHLNNICMIDGQPVLFDAIEFNDEFSCIDVLYDLAFLLMDMMRHCLDACANALLNRYLETTGDYDGLAALPLFLSCRAAISAHVAISRARQTSTRNTNAPRDEASELLDFALACFTRDRPRLIAIGGISGTGKSTMACALAKTVTPAPGAVVLRSDIIRKRMLGVADGVRLSESAYTPGMHDRVYAALVEHAGSILAGGYSVIVDAVFGRPTQRVEIERLATDRGMPFFGLWLEAPTDVLKNRIAHRHGDASDATMRIVDAQLSQIEKPAGWAVIDASGAIARALALANLALAQTRNIPAP